MIKEVAMKQTHTKFPQKCFPIVFPIRILGRFPTSMIPKDTW